jgi:serine/threonine-protein kinase HipA
MNREIDVHIHWQGNTIVVGKLWARWKGNRQTSSFEYVAEWIGRDDSFALAPDLPLSTGQFHSDAEALPAREAFSSAERAF